MIKAEGNHSGSLREPELIRFGAFELELAAGVLRRSGRRLALAPQPFAVLSFLARRVGRAVSREELRRHVWGDNTVVEYDASLNRCIRQIRAVLGDSPTAPRFIETLPRRGYRFLGPAELVVDPQAADGSRPVAVDRRPEASPKGSAGRRFQFRRSLWPWLVVAILAMLAVGAALQRQRVSPTVNDERTVLAVLPFEDLEDDGIEHLAAGVTEELIAELSRLSPQRLGVIARTSSVRYRGTNRSVAEIAAELRADYLIEGTVRRRGSQLRLNARLIRTEDFTSLWSQSYERNLPDLLSAQIDFAAGVGRALAVELELRQVPPRPQTKFPPSADPQALDAYLQGRYLLDRRGAEDLVPAKQAFERAIALAPGYAAAHAWLGESTRLLASNGTRQDREQLATARRHALRALELDPSSSIAHLVVAYCRWLLEWDWDGAEAAYRRALELDPGSARVNHRAAYFLSARGLGEAAIRHIEEARYLDPVSPRVHRDVAWFYLLARRYEDSAHAGRRTLELAPNNTLALFCIMEGNRLLGQEAPAKEALANLAKSAGAPAALLSALENLEMSRAYRRVLQWLQDLVINGSVVFPAYEQAFLELSLDGDPERALALLEDSLDGLESPVVMLAVDPRFDPLREAPGYRRLLRLMNFPTEEP